MNRIALLRLRNQNITDSNFRSPVEVAAWMLALQGQDYHGSKWSLGLRSPGSTEVEVETALAAGQILRTWLMRGTLHLVHAADIHWLLQLIGPRVIQMNARRYRELELDEATMKKSSHLLVKALQSNERQDRKSLMKVLESAGISTAGQRAPYLLQWAALERLIVQTAVIRNEPVYAMLAEAEPGMLLDREQALAELARRYFTARGPASLRDFGWWSGLTLSDARVGLAQVEEQLVREKIGDTEYWFPPGEPVAEIRSPVVELLPGFDEYLLAYKDRSAIMDVEMKTLAGKNGMISPTIIIDGHISGTWKRTLKKDQIEVVAKAFEPFAAAQKDAVTEAAARFGVFLDLPVVMQFEG